MPEQQLDLFAGAGIGADRTTVPDARRHIAGAELDDDSLIAAIPPASLTDCRNLTDEAARRRLGAAIPALETLCRRFRGFGYAQPIPEQTAALEALTAIGGRNAAQTITRLIVDGVVQGPGLKTAVTAAARLGANLPAKIVSALLRHEVAEIRAAACRCAGASSTLVPLLIELLEDRNVTREAACALGRMGRREARPTLLRLLQEHPTAAVVEAVILIADEECVVFLGRIARSEPGLAEAAFAALEDIGSPRALTIAAAARLKG